MDPKMVHISNISGGYLYLAPLLDSKSKSELSESSGASQRYGASEQSKLSLRYGVGTIKVQLHLLQIQAIAYIT